MNSKPRSHKSCPYKTVATKWLRSNMTLTTALPEGAILGETTEPSLSVSLSASTNSHITISHTCTEKKL